MYLFQKPYIDWIVQYSMLHNNIDTPYSNKMHLLIKYMGIHLRRTINVVHDMIAWVLGILLFTDIGIKLIASIFNFHKVVHKD